ncbi:MAG: putative heptosyltransferase [Candidatus Scalindua rubra]|uniref:Putative heptosyltransferase n=1 Tax=Candidatus Scalindua rubra TaxID=1872076 RepID=A0A1E3XGW4_9BACT|nr:MAG: putative heptosyltransferase [Candidatus Scalindua rubra]
MSGKYEKILIMEAGGIGDIIMSTPVLRALRERFSNSDITLLTVPRTAQALNIKHYANRILYFKQEAFSKGPSKSIYKQIFSNLKLLLGLRKERFDMMVDLEAIETWKSSLLRYIFYKSVGAKNKVGRNSDGKGFFLDVKVHDDLFGTVHEVDRKLLIARELGADTNNTKQEFSISSEDREFINNWLLDSGVDDNRTVVAIQPGAFVPTRQWKSQRFIEVGKRLCQKYGAQIILTGGNNDNVVYEIKDELKDAKPILAIGFSLGRLGALLERVQLFISNDTGPFHIADAINTPFVVIFGPENFHRYGPYDTKSKSRIVTGMKVSCSPCLKYECRTHECMESITPDMVWEGVESLMKEIVKEKLSKEGTSDMSSS